MCAGRSATPRFLISSELTWTAGSRSDSPVPPNSEPSWSASLTPAEPGRPFPIRWPLPQGEARERRP
jgi:hypothetical protein